MRPLEQPTTAVESGPDNGRPRLMGIDDAARMPRRMPSLTNPAFDRSCRLLERSHPASTPDNAAGHYLARIPVIAQCLMYRKLPGYCPERSVQTRSHFADETRRFFPGSMEARRSAWQRFPEPHATRTLAVPRRLVLHMPRFERMLPGKKRRVSSPAIHFQASLPII
jgi:hypothetical protein